MAVLECSFLKSSQRILGVITQSMVNVNREYYRSINACSGCACSLAGIISRHGRGPIPWTNSNLWCTQWASRPQILEHALHSMRCWPKTRKSGCYATVRAWHENNNPTPWWQCISYVFCIYCTWFLKNALWLWSVTNLICDGYVALHLLRRTSNAWDDAGGVSCDARLLVRLTGLASFMVVKGFTAG